MLSIPSNPFSVSVIMGTVGSMTAVVYASSSIVDRMTCVSMESGETRPGILVDDLILSCRFH
jgi:hypothetical protein